MKIKLDENLSRHLKPLLNALSHHVSTAADERLLSKPDSLVASVSRAEGKMLFTLDLEFGDLRKYPPGTHPGIILFRLKSNGPLAVNQFIRKFVKETDLRHFIGCNVVVEDNKVRVRRPSASPEEEVPPSVHEAPAIYKARKSRSIRRKRE